MPPPLPSDAIISSAFALALVAVSPFAVVLLGAPVDATAGYYSWLGSLYEACSCPLILSSSCLLVPLPSCVLLVVRFHKYIHTYILRSIYTRTRCWHCLSVCFFSPVIFCLEFFTL